MKLSHLAIFALLSILLWNAASAKFTEYLVLQVFDNNYQVVEGAQVYVQYQLNGVDGNVFTKPKLTNASGEALIEFTNYEEINASTEYSYTAYAKYGEKTYTTGLIAGLSNRTNPRKASLVIEAYFLTVRVQDQSSRPIISNVTIYSNLLINDTQVEQTDSSGRAVFRVPPGNFDIRAETASFSSGQTLEVNSQTGDRAYDFVIPLYSLEVTVTDDNLVPREAEVEVGDQAKNTSSLGKAHFENITDSSPTVKIKSGTEFKNVKVRLDRQSTLEVVFDDTKPVIRELYATVSKAGVGTITLFADDTGQKASGIDTVTVSYEVAGKQNLLQTYSVGYNSFEAKIPAQPVGTMVKYSVTVTDKGGNSASGAGSYVVQGDGGTKPAPGKTPDTGFFAGVSIEGIAIGIVAFIIAVYGAVYYFNKKKEEEEADATSPYKEKPAQPPTPPPSAPPTVPKE